MESKGSEVEGNRESLMANFVPHVGMEFRTSDEAWAFWLSYGGQKGFEVRKRYTNKRPSDGKITSCKFVCANEGHRLPDKRDHLTKCPRAETRTDCQVHMNLKIVRKKETLIVSDLVLEHNHALHLPTTLHLMVSQRKISDLQGFGIETADDAGIGPKAAHELASRQVGGPLNLSYTLRDHKNYLRTKRQREIAYGQAGSMLKYFHDKIAENPSFQYALQMDCEEQITNIFWADAKMIMDYAHFGDVVSFDTTFGTNKESRPFGVFVGFNHFRETVVFGAALMYDETFESFKWLFETFLKSHNGQQPKTFYTDQDAAMGKAVSQVFTEAWHGLCTFHIMQNAVKHLHEENIEEENEENRTEKKKEKKRKKKKEEENEENEETSILSDFSACMFEYEDIAEFEQKFNLMRQKVSKLYTPIIFEAFQGEYERSLAACTKALDGINEYVVGDFTYEEEYKVVGDPLKETVVCSCRQFDRIGILCSHALKVLDLMNIKSLPSQYVLKRWTREARTITVQDNQGRNIIENPKMDAMLRFKYMSHKFLNLAHEAANSPECTMLVDSTLDILRKQMAEKINTSTSTFHDSCTASANASPPNDLLINASLKKKDVQTKTSKRKRTWLDKKHKTRKKRENKATSQFGEAGNNDVVHGQEAVSGGAQAQEGLCPLFPEPSNSSGAQAQAQGAFCPFFPEASSSGGTQAQVSFTQMLMGPMTNDLLSRFW